MMTKHINPTEMTYKNMTPWLVFYYI